MGILSIFRPAPACEEIQDSKQVDKEYKYWRYRTFYAMYAGYAFFYFSRKSFTFAMPAMQNELGLGKFELGLLASIFSLSYGASKFLSGIIGDKANPRYFMSIGLILTGFLNLFFGMSSFLWTFALFWGLNGLFQGWGWPGCARLLTHWYSPNERGRWWSMWNTSHNLGGALIPILAGYCAEYFGWRYALYVPGVFCIAAGLFVMNRLRDTPQSLGLPPIERYRDDYSSTKNEKGEKELSTKEILWNYVLTNRYIWILSLAYFLIYVIRTAVNDWSMLYLIEVKRYTNLEAGKCVFWFEIGGIFGSLFAGWASDVVFKGRRNPINVLFMVGILAVLFTFQRVDHLWPMLDGVFIFWFGFFIFGPQMLIGMAAAELSHKKAAATATGFAGCFAYLGAAAAGGPLGAITKIWGWESFFVTLAICGYLSVLLMLPLWSIKVNPKVRRLPDDPLESPDASAAG